MPLSSLDKIQCIIIFLQVLLPNMVLLLMFVSRVKAVKSGEVPLGYFKKFQPRENFSLPEYVELPARNFTNLFELPVLFFALMPLLFYFQKVDTTAVILSALFVLSRYAHTLIHVTVNKIKYRMQIYFVGVLVVLALWMRFLTQVLQG